ncbi:class I SAM-dependent methyltransferase [Frankia sp. EAN1pec]|uniref:methyltransferase domain-containing protein n=1 Tax=Parafrankia sp. (strain EAN1pec) TaxID=298653 RepID=UPI000054098C
MVSVSVSEWDETLYGGSAEFYAAGRLPYPPALAETLRAALGHAPVGRLLDVGCGPGSLTLLVAGLFEAAVGLDPDPDMISYARAAAQRAGTDNVTWVRMRAEDLPGGLGVFRVVSFAQSFHWLGRPRVAAAVHPMLAPDGRCVFVHATTHEGVPGDDVLPHPRPPREVIASLVRDYLGLHRRAGRSVLPQGTPSGENDIFRAAGLGTHPAERGRRPRHRTQRRRGDRLGVLAVQHGPPPVW